MEDADSRRAIKKHYDELAKIEIEIDEQKRLKRQAEASIEVVEAQKNEVMQRWEAKQNVTDSTTGRKTIRKLSIPGAVTTAGHVKKVDSIEVKFGLFSQSQFKEAQSQYRHLDVSDTGSFVRISCPQCSANASKSTINVENPHMDRSGLCNPIRTAHNYAGAEDYVDVHNWPNVKIERLFEMTAVTIADEKRILKGEEPKGKGFGIVTGRKRKASDETPKSNKVTCGEKARG